MQNATLEVEDGYVKIYNDDETKYFDNTGKEVTNIQVYPNNKIFIKKENNKYGFMDSQGKTVVDCKYDKAYELNEYGFASVKKDGKWGAINEQGEEVIEPSYEFGDKVKPIFVGKYYRVMYGFGEIYFTDDIK